MMMEYLWRSFCGQHNCSESSIEPCSPWLVSVTHPSSCFNHALIIFFDVLILILLLINLIYKSFSKKAELRASYKHVSVFQIWSAVINGSLGLVYLGLGFWILVKDSSHDHSVLGIHWWVLYFCQGITWLLVGLIIGLRGDSFRRAPFRILANFAFISTVISCILAMFAIVFNHETTIKVALDILTFIGASLLLVCVYKGYENEETGDIAIGSSLYSPLYGDANYSSCKSDSDAHVTSYEKAGWLSKMSFWWMNSLMTFGKGKTLEEQDIPGLRDVDRAESCYLQFLNKLNKKKEDQPSSESTIFWTIIICNFREILISGLFALLKILTQSAGPLLLNAFIKVAEGNEAFRYEGYLLVVLLLFSKILESLSQRQWFFRTRLMGLKVRSLFTAAIYRKQLRLSNVAKMTHPGAAIMNYVTVDAYRIGEFPFWLHQTWTTILQLCIALLIMINAVGLATIAAIAVIIISLLCSTPLAKLQHIFQSKLMVAQDDRLKACSESLINMKVLKLYAWETHFKTVIEELREVEYKWLSTVQFIRSFNALLFWISPVLVSAAIFGACYFLDIPLRASNVFTCVATLRLVQEPIRAIPNVTGVVIQAKVAFSRIVNFLQAPELQIGNVRKESDSGSNPAHVILMKAANLSWENNPSKPTLGDMNLKTQHGEKVAICGEVGSGKSTLLAAILGELQYVEGIVEVYGSIAYVSQTAWIQTGSIRDNILFGSAMDEPRYLDTLRRCSLVKDLELLPWGDMTEIGERGVNLSGGQKQRIQLARALYRDADIYLLDDPFSAVDAHTATSLFNEYVMDALSTKTVLLVTHQVDFLPSFHSCLLMSDGGILRAGPYHELLASSPEFLDLVNAHKETAGTETLADDGASVKGNYSMKEIKEINVGKHYKASEGGQLIKQEEREVGDTGLKPYLVYLNQNKGFLYFGVLVLGNLAFVGGQILQNSWMASSISNPLVSSENLIVVYLVIGLCSTFFLLTRALVWVTLGMESSKSLFSQLLNSLFHAPMSFYDSTPLGRILSRVSADLSIVDLEIAYSFQIAASATTIAFLNLAVLAVISWRVLLVSIPVIYLAVVLQRYYFATAKELMRLNGTTKSLVANHLVESVAGAMTIRAFMEEEVFFANNLDLIDANASTLFHNFAANEWLSQRLEVLSAFVLSSAALCMVLLPPGTFSSGFIGMALSYGLSLNLSMVFAIQNQCMLANHIISVERLNQYMHISSEAPEVIEDRRPPSNWPLVGKVEICDLQIRYRPDTPLVLRGINCTFEGGDKIGIVGRTGSGKTTLIGALFRLVEPAGGKIVVDGINICLIGLHDLRSCFGIIPQDPTLFHGTVRFNLDPLHQHEDDEIWEVLGKCQLKDVVQEKEHGLDSLVVEDGSNWSMGQRQLFCLARALLRRSRVLVLDEATASIDNATDTILQRTIRTEFKDCTVITVAHRIPTVMDCTKILAISEGKLVEYDEPMKLMKREDSLFGQLVKEYWSHIHSADNQ